LDNLGMIGAFMLNESWHVLKNSWGKSREDFWEALDKSKETMIKSGKWAMTDIERAYGELHKSWDLLNAQKEQERDSFLNELKERLSKYSDISWEIYENAVNNARETIDRQWEQFHKMGNEQMTVVKEQTATWANMFKDHWDTFRTQMDKTGKKVDKAVNAAWDELKKKD
jgi:hypothetical protein